MEVILILPGYVYHINNFFLDYSDTKVMRYLNAELADTLGNLLSRCTGAALNPFQTFPKINSSSFQSISLLDVTKSLLESVAMLPGR